MAVEVTIESTYRNDDYFGSETTTVYSYAGSSSGGGSGTLPLAGGVDNRVITALGEASMQAEENLTFDGSNLEVTGEVKISGLAGTGRRDVRVDADGNLITTSGVLVGYTNCPADTTTNISIGLGSSDVSFMLHYIAERDMGTVQKQSGLLIVLYDDVSENCSVFPPLSAGNDLDFSIDADLDTGAIRLNIIVGDDNVNALSFDYTIVSKFYE